jgi:hypothetical protein
MNIDILKQKIFSESLKLLRIKAESYFDNQETNMKYKKIH